MDMLPLPDLEHHPVRFEPGAVPAKDRPDQVEVLEDRFFAAELFPEEGQFGEPARTVLDADGRVVAFGGEEGAEGRGRAGRVVDGIAEVRQGRREARFGVVAGVRSTRVVRVLFDRHL